MDEAAEAEVDEARRKRMTVARNREEWSGEGMVLRMEWIPLVDELCDRCYAAELNTPDLVVSVWRLYCSW
jgi:hypothetical protein